MHGKNIKKNLSYYSTSI